MNQNMVNQKLRAVVVGGGFGGMQAAQSLSKMGLDTLLIDRNNYNTFVPLLYQVAAGQIEPAKIAYPLRTIIRRSKNLRFLMDEVRHINFSDQLIETTDAVIPYNFLVLATGSQTRYLGVPGADQHAFSMRNLNEAIAIRNHILSCVEQANCETDERLRQQLLTFVIVGGGATGVELAGTLVELKRVFKKDYPDLDVRQVRIILVQSHNTLLGDLPPALGRYALRKLIRIGVKVRLESRVSEVTPTSVRLESGERISSATVIWTAGLEAARPSVSDNLKTASKGKLVVHPTLQLEHHPNVYVIGDLAYVKDLDPPLTGVAPEALQQGVAVARNIKRQMQCRIPKPFNYFNKGRLAIIGCYSGVGKIGPVLLTGFLPWLMWLLVHLVYLPGFRSRLLVLASWFHSYLLGDRTVRLILNHTHSSRLPLTKSSENIVQDSH
ncbi:MAG: NAD(P)/FAD-dependent oxidoreductase [Leptolyngbyaceae bacterium]|nr:NAD(P)/FAD-dependent oxidoreductase [Leptolyngbyaceae bacterium]